jgi:hypothetical protein
MLTSYNPLLYKNLKLNFIKFPKRKAHCTKDSLTNWYIQLVKIYNFYLKHFSIWWLFYEMQGKVISGCVHCGICCVIRFVSTVNKHQGQWCMQNTKDCIWKITLFHSCFRYPTVQPHPIFLVLHKLFLNLKFM